MKKATSVFGCVLIAFMGIFPLTAAVISLSGYTFTVEGCSFFAVATAVWACGAVVFSAVTKEPIKNKGIQTVFALLAPLSLINTAWYVSACDSVWVAACMFVSIGCCCRLTVKHGGPIVLKILALAVSALVSLPIGFFWLLGLLFGDFGQTTVVKTVVSPQETYYAQVIDSDQGALGGDTFVDVYETVGISMPLVKITKHPARVYQGEWGAHRSMEIYWKDETCLVINSVEYTVG